MSHVGMFRALRRFPLSAKFELRTSSSVLDETIINQFTCDGRNISTILAWIGRPGRAQSFVPIMHDRDDLGSPSMHWVVYHSPASVTEPLEAAPPNEELAGGTRQGVRDSGNAGYLGPCPPSHVLAEAEIAGA